MSGKVDGEVDGFEERKCLCCGALRCVIGASGWGLGEGKLDERDGMGWDGLRWAGIGQISEC